MDKLHIPTLILGAGPAGIGAALSLQSEALVLERMSTPGGQSGSFQIGEAYFDIGGHSFHTPHPFVRDLVFNSLEMFEQPRKACCFFRGDVIPYPFQKNFRLLTDAAVVGACAEGLPSVAPPSEECANFEEFILTRFGPGIAEHFMLPYNRKLWACPLEDLDTNWTGERVAAPEGIQEKFQLTGGKRKPLQAETLVGYPAKGGYGEIFRALGKRLDTIRYGVTVKQINLQERTVQTDCGELFTYDSLITTLPVIPFLKMTTPIPAEVLNSTRHLKAMSLRCAMLAINHPVDTDIQRFYCPHNDIPAHKIAINHNSSDWLRSRAHHGVMGEISYSQEKPLPDGDLLKIFAKSLITLGVIKTTDEVLGGKLVDVEYAYPVPTHHKQEAMQRISQYLSEQDVWSIGRFAQWDYINSDEALAQGLHAGEAILSGRTPTELNG